MIDIVVSNGCCPHCLVQEGIMKRAFSAHEYRIIEFGTEAFEHFDMKDKVDAVPFIVVRGSEGQILYANKGVVADSDLRNIVKAGEVSKEKKPRIFNLREARAAEAVEFETD